MKISRVGGIIAAAGKERAHPLVQIGSISGIERIVITFQQAGIFPIVVVTGTDEEEVKYRLAPYGVIFLRNEDWKTSELWTSAKTGLKFLKGKCERVVFTPVNVPMFTPDTLRRLLHCSASIVTPVWKGKGGHPIVISDHVIDLILSYNGKRGLRGAIRSLNSYRQRLNVNDEGVCISIHNAEQLQQRLGEHNRAILNSNIKISIEKETAFFDSRLKLLLYMIEYLGSVYRACTHMALSQGKAWDMLNKLEQELGYPVVKRQHGGKRGGGTSLTSRGKRLLVTYQRFEENVLEYARDEFFRLFRKNGLI